MISTDYCVSDKERWWNSFLSSRLFRGILTKDWEQIKFLENYWTKIFEIKTATFILDERKVEFEDGLHWKS